MNDHKLFSRSGCEAWSSVDPSSIPLPSVWVEIFPGGEVQGKHIDDQIGFGFTFASRYGDPIFYLHFYVRWCRPRPYALAVHLPWRLDRPQFTWRRPGESAA